MLSEFLDVTWELTSRVLLFELMQSKLELSAVVVSDPKLYLQLS